MKYLLIIAALTITACGSTKDACKNLKFENRPNMFVLGDSHSWGACDSQATFVYPLAQIKKLNIQNYAISGSRAAKHLEQLNKFNLTANDTVIYLAGYNDMDTTGWNVEYEITFAQILDRLVASGATVYVGGILPYVNNKPNAASFNEQLKSMVLARPSINFIPVFENFQPALQFYKQNGDIHLNQTGNSLLLNIFLQFIR